MLYQIIVVLHVVSVFAYLLSHGVSVTVSFALRRERNMGKIKYLLELSGNSYPMMFRTLYASILFGVLAGFQGHWWGRGWIWVSILLLFVIYVLMIFFGGIVYGSARKAAGLPYSIRGKLFPAETPQSDEKVFEILAKGNPIMLTIIGYGGFAVIAWLMTAKPF